MTWKTLLPVLALSLWITIQGCSLKEMRQQSEHIENLGKISGQIVTQSRQKGSIVVLKFVVENGRPVLESQVTADFTGRFKFTVTPGDYFIGAFIDVNGDGRYQKNEHGVVHGLPALITVSQQEHIELPQLVISGIVPQTSEGTEFIERISPIWKDLGKIVNLDHSDFTRANYRLGLWRPVDFLNHVNCGLFFLQEYDKNKIPVLFIHGASGGPTDWRSTIESLDTTLYQPWVLYYPSGFRLDIISDFMVEAITRLHTRYAFEKIYVIGHSMGGLLARSFAMKYLEHDKRNAQRLSLMVTINSPMAGMASAAVGVNNSPIVVPSWRDVAPGSNFLTGVYAWKWPRALPYHLFISYINGESGDGVVTLQSQASLVLQKEASRIHLFNASHAGILDDVEFHRELASILKSCSQ